MIAELKDEIKQKQNDTLLQRHQHHNVYNDNVNEQQLQIQNDNNNNTTNTTNESIDDIFLSHLLDRRFLLKKKLILFEIN